MESGAGGSLKRAAVFVSVDYVTEVMVGILNKELSSQIGFRGIFKKVVIFSLVAVAHIIDTHMIGNGGVLRTAVIFFYLSNEGISIPENAAKIGLPELGCLLLWRRRTEPGLLSGGC